MPNRRAITAAALAACFLAGCYTPHENSDADTGQSSLGPHQRQYIQGFAEGLDDVPDVEFVREIDLGEQIDVQVQCLRDAGWTVQATKHHYSVTGTAPDDQALKQDTYKCAAMYPLREKYLQPADDARYEALYNYQVSTLTPCLENLGFVISEPPTFQVWKEQFNSPNAWSPSEEAFMASTEDQNAQAEKECPQTPPDEVLYPN